MRRTVRLASGIAAFGITGLVAMPAAVAQSVDCAVYPDRCIPSDVVVDRQPVVVVDTVQDRQETSSVTTATNPSTLPFTGGEVALLGVVGAGALAVGTALVVAGRRRSSATA